MSDDEDLGTVATLSSVWRYRRWRWLLGSTLVSLAGDFLYFVALAVFLTRQDNPALWLSLSFIAKLLPWVAFGPIGGAIADRVSRRPLLIGLDLARCALFCAMAAAVALDAHPAIVLVLLAVVSTCSAIYRPARIAAIPQLVPESDLAAANAAEEGLAQLAWFVGPALGAVLVAILDPGVVLLIDAATFLASAAMVARIGSAGGGRVASDDPDEPSLLAEVREGAVVLGRDRGLRGLAVISAAASLAFGAEQVLYVLVASDRLGMGAESIGYVFAAMGVGGVIAAPLSARAGNSPRVGWWLAVTGIVAASALVGVSLTGSLPIILAIAVVEGAAAVVFEVVALTLTQRAVEENLLGRVSSVLDALATVGQTLGSIAAPILVATTSLTFALQFIGGFAVVLIVVTTPAALTMAATTDERRRRYREMTRFLGATRELGPLGPFALERLARATVVQTVPAGTDVVVTGDVADDLYVVRSGTLRVSATIEHATDIPDLGPGDLFGEIGLLRNMARTATVTSITDVELGVIDGSVFVAAVLPSGDATSPLVGGMRSRLGRTHPHLLDAEPATTDPGTTMTSNTTSDTTSDTTSRSDTMDPQPDPAATPETADVEGHLYLPPDERVGGRPGGGGTGPTDGVEPAS